MNEERNDDFYSLKTSELTVEKMNSGSLYGGLILDHNSCDGGRPAVSSGFTSSSESACLT